MSQRISQDFIQQLLERTNIVDVVSASVSIKLKGKDHQGCCPFHQEKTPSFTVSSEKQFYHCFGCGAHGNAISFLIEHNNRSFPEAVEELAAQASLDIVYEGGGTPIDMPDPALSQLLEQATSLYSNKLEHHPPAQQYLEKRGVSKDIQHHFDIGYAPNDWHTLQTLCKDKSIQPLLITNGMMIDRDKTYDRFRDRIMFPIRNTQGKVVGFGGRSLGDATPKYLNSPETPIFHKNQELYGLYEARKTNPKLPYVIVVEGYMDVIALAQYHFTMAIATLGTAVNTQHIRKILRYTKRIIYCFDGDAAGQKAAWKALQATLPLLTQGVDIKFLSLPAKQDPDSFVRQHGQSAFKAAQESAPRIPEKLFEELAKRYPLNNIATQTQFAHEAMTCIETIPAGFYQDLMLKALADKLNMDIKSLHKLRDKPQQHTEQTVKPTNKAFQVSRKQRQNSSKIQLKPTAEIATNVLLHHPSFINNIDPDLKLPTPTTMALKILHTMIKLLRQQPKLTTGQLYARLASTELQPHLQHIASQNIHLPSTTLEAELTGAIKHLQQQQLQQRTDQFIAKAKEQSLDSDEKQQLQQLLTQLNENKIE